jgi:hypothetical protein
MVETWIEPKKKRKETCESSRTVTLKKDTITVETSAS